MFNLGKKKSTIKTPVLFHKEVNGLIEHGVLCAEHASLNITKNDAVRFAFEGIEPPQMTPEVLFHIFDQAERKGYIVSHLHSYATMVQLHVRPQLRPKSDQPTPVLHSREVPEPRTGQARTPRRPSGDRAHVA